MSKTKFDKMRLKTLPLSKLKAKFKKLPTEQILDKKTTDTQEDDNRRIGRLNSTNSSNSIAPKKNLSYSSLNKDIFNREFPGSNYRLDTINENLEEQKTIQTSTNFNNKLLSRLNTMEHSEQTQYEKNLF